MSIIQRTALQVRQFAAQTANPPLGDDALLARFAASRDEAAFAELVRRHGTLVKDVARRVLGEHHAAEDVVQATFLLLARKADSAGWRATIAPWLYAVAFRLAKKASRQHRSPDASRSVATAAQSDPAQPLLWAEVRAALDEELARLPRRLHDPLVLCYLQGRTRDEAAKALGWSLAMLKRRLERGRELLRVRLTRRGLALSAIGSVAVGNAAVLAGDAIDRIMQQVARGGVSSPATVLLAGSFGPRWAKVVLALSMMMGVGAAATWWLRRGPEPAALTLGPELSSAGVLDVSDDPLPPGAIARLGTNRLRPGGMIRAMAFSPDSKQLAIWNHNMSSDHASSLIFADPKSGKTLRSLALPPNEFYTMRWLADGRGLALTKIDRREYFLWQFTDGVATFPVKEKPDATTKFTGDIHSAAISPDGRWLATGRQSYDNAERPIELFATKPNALLTSLKPTVLGRPLGCCLALVFSTDNKLLFAVTRALTPNPTPASPGDWDKHARLTVYDVAVRKELQSFPVAPPTMMSNGWMFDERVAVTLDGTSVLIGSEDGYVRAYNWKQGKEVKSLEACTGGNGEVRKPRVGVNFLAFSDDGSKLYISGRRNSVTIRDAKTWKPLQSFGDDSGSEGCSTALSPDGKKLAVKSQAGWNSSVAIVDPATGERLFQLPGHTNQLIDLRVLAGGKAITTGADNQLRYWDIEKGKELTHRAVEPIYIMDFGSLITPDGKGLLSRKDHSARYIDLTTGAERIVAAGDAKNPAGFSGVSGNKVFLRTGDGKVREWDADRGNGRSFDPPTDAEGKPLGGRIAASRDGRRLISTSSTVLRSGNLGYQQGSTIHLYDASTGKIFKRWSTPDAHIIAAEFSPDGRYLAFGGRPASSRDRDTEDRLPVPANYGVVVLDADSGDPIRVLKPAEPSRTGADVRAIAISRDSHLLATTQPGNVIAVYELETGQLCQLFKGHESLVRQLEFTDDGRRLVSISSDTTGLVWDVSLASLAKPAARDREQLWADLAKPEWPLAGPAMAALAQKPETLLALVKQKIPAADKADLDREAIGKWLTQLDDPIFAVRERASAELERLGRESLPLLRNKRSQPPNREYGARLQRVIEHINRSPAPSEMLRAMRVIAILRQLQSTVANDALKRLAAGHAEAELTRCARAALDPKK